MCVSADLVLKNILFFFVLIKYQYRIVFISLNIIISRAHANCSNCVRNYNAAAHAHARTRSIRHKTGKVCVRRISHNGIDDR